MHIKPQSLPVAEPTAAIRSHFASSPWCSAMFKDSDKFVPLQTSNRVPKRNTEDQLVAVTLATAETIKAWQSFYSPDLSDGPGEFCVLLTLGNGLDGHAGVVHGGAISLIFDEVLTMAAHYHQEQGTHGVTAYMHVDYRKPILSPGSVLCRARLDETKSKGRKLFVNGVIEDGHGVELASANCLVISLKDDPARL